MDYGMWNDRTNMSMLTDFYELTMANGYLNSGNRDKIVYFDTTWAGGCLLRTHEEPQEERGSGLAQLLKSGSLEAKGK